MTTYVLVQSDAAAPTVDQLKRAFKFTETLRDADATKLAVEARGLLLKDLSYDQAYRLQVALKEDGVATEIVETGTLPTLPDIKMTRRMEFSDAALLIYDVLGRVTPVEWGQISVIAAGPVQHFDFNTSHAEQTVVGISLVGGLRAKTITETRHTIAGNRQLLLDILVTGSAHRYQIEVPGFLFGYCIQDPALNAEQKFARLVCMLLERALGAVPNIGAHCLSTLKPVAEYASKGAFNDEITWLLWFQQRQGASPG